MAACRTFGSAKNAKKCKKCKIEKVQNSQWKNKHNEKFKMDIILQVSMLNDSYHGWAQWITVYFHPSAVSGPENILIIRNLLLSCDAVCKEGVEKAVKTCFLSHAVTWFTPQNLGLSLLSDSNSCSV